MITYHAIKDSKSVGEFIDVGVAIELSPDYIIKMEETKKTTHVFPAMTRVFDHYKTTYLNKNGEEVTLKHNGWTLHAMEDNFLYGAKLDLVISDPRGQVLRVVDFNVLGTDKSLQIYNRITENDRRDVIGLYNLMHELGEEYGTLWEFVETL